MWYSVFSLFLPSSTNQFDEHSAQWTQPASDGTYQYFIKVGFVCICVHCSSVTSFCPWFMYVTTIWLYKKFTWFSYPGCPNNLYWYKRTQDWFKPSEWISANDYMLNVSLINLNVAIVTFIHSSPWRSTSEMEMFTRDPSLEYFSSMISRL